MTPVFPPIGMSPSVWGPIFWNAMHIVTLGYSDSPSKDEQEAVASYFESLAFVIPCPICRTHYSEFLRQMPVRAVNHSRTTLVYWLFQLHNRVNAQLGKRKISWDEFVNAMRALSRSGGTGSAANTVAIAMGVVGIVIGGAAYAYYLRRL